MNAEMFVFLAAGFVLGAGAVTVAVLGAFVFTKVTGGDDAH